MSLAGGGSVDTDPLAVDPQQQELEDENPLLLLSEDVDLDHIMEEDMAGCDDRIGGGRNRSAKCGKCNGCLRPECNRCAACLDNLRFGGGKRRRYKRQNCLGKIYIYGAAMLRS